ncbi:winged helix-turn-helix domain-containing protein [Methanolapillus millepedarum]|uniref:HTH arsR-type domain-containing protein n=1 Tax=Methanolapillus millepedarum TaxID=3028296 RepID=A0AA96V4H9_9EURY|nr:hypothetical protein MsAc7_09300 [Methanosarcinaceae archaeon Ac7]
MNSVEENRGIQKPKPKDPIVSDTPDDESFEEFDADNLIIIPVNDDSKKIRQILSNETSMKILDALKKESMSSSQLSDKLGLSLTTIKYNVDILVENGLVNVKKIKYSEKGRQVKIYEAPEKVIVFAPEKISRISIVSMLQKYAFAFGCAVFAGFGFSYLFRQHQTVVEKTAMDARLMSSSENYYDLSGAFANNTSAGVVVQSAIPDAFSNGTVPPTSEVISGAGQLAGNMNIPYAGNVDLAAISNVSNMHLLYGSDAGSVVGYVDPNYVLNESTYSYVSDAAYNATVAAGSGVSAAPSGVHDSFVSISNWIYDTIGYQAFWFILGALFVCVVIWVVEYVSVSKNKNVNNKVQNRK